MFGDLTYGEIYEHMHLKDLADLGFEHSLLKMFKLVNYHLIKGLLMERLTDLLRVVDKAKTG